MRKVKLTQLLRPVYTQRAGKHTGRCPAQTSMKDRVWIKGLDNVRMLRLTAVYIYQIVMLINFEEGNALDRVKPFLNAI